MRRDACSLCGQPFQPDKCIAGGFDARGAVALTGECCTIQLVEIFALAHNFHVPASTRLTSEQITVIGRRSGVDYTLGQPV